MFVCMHVCNFNDNVEFRRQVFKPISCFGSGNRVLTFGTNFDGKFLRFAFIWRLLITYFLIVCLALFWTIKPFCNFIVIKISIGLRVIKIDRKNNESWIKVYDT